MSEPVSAVAISLASRLSIPIGLRAVPKADISRSGKNSGHERDVAIIDAIRFAYRLRALKVKDAPESPDSFRHVV